ncbi:hypothetical protein Tco_1217788 [Tanacetum coccineum]
MRLAVPWSWTTMGVSGMIAEFVMMEDELAAACDEGLNGDGVEGLRWCSVEMGDTRWSRCVLMALVWCGGSL